MDIQNLIFDLGNVIINIEPELTIKAFSEFVPHKADLIRQEVLRSPFFHDFETGKINNEQFREGIRAMYHADLSDQEIDNAWNALLLDIPESRLQLLDALKSSYRTFLLSNTNDIHVDFIVRQMEAQGQPALNQLFEQVYYSQHMNMRKPDPSIYQYVLEQNGLRAEETVFLDDNWDNIVSARSLGIVSIHIEPQKNSMLDFFKPDLSLHYPLEA